MTDRIRGRTGIVKKIGACGYSSDRTPMNEARPASSSLLQDLRGVDDWPLWSRWKDGDRHAARVLVERYAGLLQRFFHNKVRDADTSSELVSQTMFACVGALQRATEKGNFRSFIFGVASNLLRAHLRSTYKYQSEVDVLDDICVSDGARSPMDMLSWNGETRLLVRALRRIPLKFQTVLELQFFEDMTGPQIAELLGIPLGTVYTYQRRGRLRLHAVFTELADTPALAKSTTIGLETWAADIRAQLDARTAHS